MVDCMDGCPEERQGGGKGRERHWELVHNMLFDVCDKDEARVTRAAYAFIWL